MIAATAHYAATLLRYAALISMPDSEPPRCQRMLLFSDTRCQLMSYAAAA